MLAGLAATWCLLRLGPWHALPPYGRLLPAAAVAGPLAAGLRVPAAGLPWDLRAPLALLPPLAVLAAAAWTALRCRPRSGPGDPPLVLESPLRGGTVCLLQAGGPTVNRHAADPCGRAAHHGCDLTVLGSGLRWRRRRALGLMPAANESYAAYGHPVRSPCDGIVAVAVDGLPDNEPGSVDPAHPLGNHIAVDTGRALVVLAHLRPGSLRVPVGARVTAGTMLAAVGNSGDTGGEPLLHLRVETRTSSCSPGSGTALPLRLAELSGVPLRGRRFTVSG
ncbi:M23 family metallopeptidase [Peterkaempfera bronchialis]|uniref:M23 family peptidase n=1 Tax=Peterkaempfera bronchialis TaxID=2126346 RepID=A0A345SYX9_9ACTN|nr:M23 family metallopeptidase [Peterkaempfera bronchialis]AXI78934.1 M23 family peptidase [Peterkaempfera bronchialis]